MSISKFLVTVLPSPWALVSLLKMDVLHLTPVTGGEGKQTQYGSQGMFLFHRLSEMCKVAYGCQGASWAPTSVPSIRKVSRSLPRPVQWRLWTCASVPEQIFSSHLVVSFLEHPADGMRGSCVTDPKQPVLHQTFTFAPHGTPRSGFPPVGTDGPVLASSPPVSQEEHALCSLKACLCSST